MLARRRARRAYRFIESQIEQGRQAFIIYPLVEESEKVEAKAAVEEQRAPADGGLPDAASSACCTAA